MRGHRFFAAVYDQLMAGTEKAGLTDMRAELLAGAEGRTLELGAGTGLNLEHYPAAVTELVLTEPDPHMAKRLRDRAAATIAGTSSAPVSRHRASAAIPALPGAASTSGARSERASARTIACSRPPPPTTRTFNGLRP